MRYILFIVILLSSCTKKNNSTNTQMKCYHCTTNIQNLTKDTCEEGRVVTPDIRDANGNPVNVICTEK